MESYYDQDGITIYHGDCREVLPTLAGIGVIVTDPPYGIAFVAGAGKRNCRRDGETVIGDESPFNPHHLLRAADSFVLWGANNYAHYLPSDGAWLAWDKVTANGMQLRIAEYEFAWTNCSRRHQGFRHMWSGGYRDSERGTSYHPCQKPIALMQWCVGFAGGTICDPYIGSGTTLVAAKLEGRKAIGIEIEEKYCEIAAERLRQGVLSFE